ncbi:MHYT domain-containing protein [Nocardiopsis deserti]|uniref:MHYT domain-containing protein n=1 Tax=Nocardiopsis deserti TaxID=2605988 RepID=UPI00123AD5F9|nr:MHYT domain-containing protein [Nocardiopsis deserti]
MLDHLAQDWLTPSIAFAVSMIGSFLGLSFASRARRTTGLVRWQWLTLASLALGGMAVWSMHFIAMMGFEVSGTAIRYDATLTVVSGVIAIVVMAVALTLTIARRTAAWLLLGGFIAGTGVIAMHYLGMYSMNVHGEIHHDPLYVALACAVALVAATASLWFASRLRGLPAISAASVAMAVAVTTMHYTGMMGVHFTEPRFSRHSPPPGSSAPDLVLPLLAGLFVFMLICSLFLLLGVEEERPDYSPRTAAPAPPASGSEPEESATGYVPRHATGPQTALSDDVWTRRR